MHSSSLDRSLSRRVIRQILHLYPFKISDDFLSRSRNAALSIAQGKASDIYEYFVAEGLSRLESPNPCILPRVYANRIELTPDQRSLALLHYVEHGGVLAAPIHWLFDEAAAQEASPAVKDAVTKRNLISAYWHYLSAKRDDSLPFRPHWLFDPIFYRQKYDVDGNALHDFLTEGQFTGKTPSVFFDVDYYCSTYQVPQRGGIDGYPFSPLEHFITAGAAAGMVPTPDFDDAHYLRAYPDVAEAIEKGSFRSAFEHFARFGHLERRDPNQYFSARDYMDLNPEVTQEFRASGLRSPFEHFITTGRERGLRAHVPMRQVRVPEQWGKALFEKRAAMRMQEYIRNAPDWIARDRPRISCVIPVVDNFACTCSLLQQLHFEFRQHGSFEVIVVDNGSKDGTLTLQSTGNLKVIRVGEAIGYTRACNLGAAAATGDICVFMNNDIEIESGLFEQIDELMSADARLICGPRIVLSTGELQEAGGYVFADGSAMGYGRGADPTASRFLCRREVDYVSGCFLVIPKSFFDELGGFDEIFSPGYYEDTDLCLRAAQSDGRVVYQPELRITHYEYASYSAGRPPRVSAGLMARNQRTFAHKHGEWLRFHGRDRRTLSSIILGDGSGRKPEILLVEDEPPQANSGSGFSRTASIIETFGELGHSVAVWPTNQSADAAVTRWTSDGRTVETIDASAWGRDFGRFLREEGDRFQWIWVCRTHNYPRSIANGASEWRRGGADRRIILDTEAVAAARDVSLLNLAGVASSDAELRERAAIEFRDLEAIDAIVAVNGLDASLITNTVDLTPKVLGHRFSVARRPAAPPAWSDRGAVGFLGAFFGRETPNYDAVSWFTKEVLPRLRASHPEMIFKIAGHCRADISRDDIFLTAGVEFLGPQTDLEQFFDGIRVFVAPTRYAGGLPHKVQHAMAYGVPVVVTDLLARQLELAEGDAAAAGIAPVNDAAKFADQVLALYDNQGLWKKRSALGDGYIAEACDPDRFRGIVAEILSGGSRA